MKGCRLRQEHFDSKIRRFKSLYSQKKIVMPIFRNSEILWRDAYVLKNYLTVKTKIAFLLNLERPITAAAKAWQPGLPHC